MNDSKYFVCIYTSSYGDACVMSQDDTASHDCIHCKETKVRLITRKHIAYLMEN